MGLNLENLVLARGTADWVKNLFDTRFWAGRCVTIM